MARGRVGGTSSQKVGALGKCYTQVKKTRKGTYITYTYQKPTSRLSTNTPAQAKAKLINAVINRPMKALKSMLRWTMQGATNTTEAVNTFSKINRVLVERDFNENFNGWSLFTYPDKYSPSLCYGPYIISYGTLHYKLFYDHGYQSGWMLQNLGIRVGDAICYGARLLKKSTTCTIADFLKMNHLSEGSRFYFCAFLFNQEDWSGSWVYLAFQVLPYLHQNEVVTNDNLTKFIRVTGNCKYYFACGSDGDVYLGIRKTNEDINLEYWAYGFAFSTRVGGRWLCSNTQMIVDDIWPPGETHQNNPAYVWEDWLNNYV